MQYASFRLRQNLTLLLKDRNMTAAQLSKKTGIAKQVLSDWMSGVQPRKLEHLFAVANILNISLERLCFSDAPLQADQGTANAYDQLCSKDEIRGKYEIYLRRLRD